MFYLLLTSWKKRIHNVKTILKSVLNNTIKPHKTWLCLSESEFKDKWKELPEDLIRFISLNKDIIEIKWIKGENTKTWKKMFPVINELNDEDIIMFTDDDIILPKRIIEDRLNDFKRYKGEYAISGRRFVTVFNELHIMGATSVYKKKMLNNWERVFSESIKNTYHDERFCAQLLWLNGYKTKPNTKNDLCDDNIMRDYLILDDVALYKTTNSYGGNDNFDRLMDESVKKITGRATKNSFGIFREHKNVVVAMTSWKKRINNVKPVVESILRNSIIPDKIYISLSVSEFPNRESDLPSDLVELKNSNEHVIINWVEGENTKTMKKIFPILQYLDDDDIIINADDDMLFPPNLIKSRLSTFKNNNNRCAVSSKQKKSINFQNKLYVLGPTSLFQKKMFNNWEKVVNDRVMRTYNDDRVYLYLLWLNGYLNVPCVNFEIDEMRKFYNYNVIEGSGESGLYPIGRAFDRIVQPLIENMTGKSLDKSFGYFRKR